MVKKHNLRDGRVHLYHNFQQKEPFEYSFESYSFQPVRIFYFDAGALSVRLNPSGKQRLNYLLVCCDARQACIPQG